MIAINVISDALMSMALFYFIKINEFLIEICFYVM